MPPCLLLRGRLDYSASAGMYLHTNAGEAGRGSGLRERSSPFQQAVVWPDLVTLKRAIEGYSCVGPGGQKGPGHVLTAQLPAGLGAFV